MNIQQIKKLKAKSFNRDMLVLDKVPSDAKITSGSYSFISTESDTFENNLETLHNFRLAFGKYTLGAYWLGGSKETLIISYHFQVEHPKEEKVLTLSLCVECTDLENALDKVGSGHCKVVDVVHPAIETKTIQCDL